MGRLRYGLIGEVRRVLLACARGPGRLASRRKRARGLRRYSLRRIVGGSAHRAHAREACEAELLDGARASSRHTWFMIEMFGKSGHVRGWLPHKRRIRWCRQSRRRRLFEEHKSGAREAAAAAAVAVCQVALDKARACAKEVAPRLAALRGSTLALSPLLSPPHPRRYHHPPPAVGDFGPRQQRRRPG